MRIFAMAGLGRSARMAGGALLAAVLMGPAPLADGALEPGVGGATPSRASAPNDMVARGRQGAVVTAEPHATAVGLSVLANGGNAVDAAVAVALTLAVTHPQAGNLGGGGFMLIRFADGRAAAIDFRERAPLSAHKDLYVRPDGTVDEDRIQHGATAAGVPGSPAGLCLALSRYGSRPLAELAKPAIALARHGFVVDHFLARALRAASGDLARFASTKDVFFRDGETVPQGFLLQQPDLAGTLERLAEHGHAGFYEGETAERIAAYMQARGAYVTAEDLRSYAAAERDPLRGSYRGREVLAMPPPSSGGVALLQMLNLLEPFDLSAMGFGSAQGLHLLTEAMRRAYADRARWLGDPDFVNVPTAGLISKDYATKLAAGMRLDKRSEVEPGLPPGGTESDDTTHFSIVDAAGNAVACTTTINSTFGSGDVVAGCGFLLNNEMDDFVAKPGVPNQFGLLGGKQNAIAPQKRMLSSMTPTIVTKGGKLELVLGAPGGGRIINAVLQVVSNVVDHDMGLESAVRAPRIHHQWRPDEIFYEEFALPPEVREGLAQRGHALAARPQALARVQAIMLLQDGEMVAVCDHRSGGSAGAR